MKIQNDHFISTIIKNKKIFLSCIAAVICLFGLFLLLGKTDDVVSFDYFGFVVLGYVIFFYIFVAHRLQWLNRFFFWIVPVINFFVLESFMHDPLAHIQIYTMAFNISFYYLFFLLLLFIFKNEGIAVIGSGVTAYAIGMVNYAVIAFRQNPVLPWDLLSVGTAVKVAGNYHLPITTNLVMLSAWLLLVLVFGFFMLNRKRTFQKSTRFITIFCLIVTFFLGYFFAQSPSLGNYVRISDSLFVPASYFKHNGYVLGFMRSLQYVDVDAPDGYSSDESKAILDSYNSEDKYEGKQPNIIVVMNEAFSDLSVLGDFSTNEDYLPYWKSLSENTVRGNLHVSVKGGNTANSEFEFLTGNSMAFLPAGSVPYELYIKEQTPSLASYLKKEFNYDTYAVHPYAANAWRRNEVYPLLGFDQMFFMNDFSEDSKMVRKFISDAATFDKIIDLYESRNDDKGFFTFCVTVQNHGGYNDLYDNFIPSIVAEGMEDEVTLNHYLSLVKESDKAFQDFIAYFEKVEEPTVILMFGDHQPTDEMIKGLLDYVDHDPADLENFEKQYITPFAIWANYDIEEAYIHDISCNYLSSVLLDTAGIPLSSYQNYLKMLREIYPVLTANCAVERSGNYLNPDQFLSDKHLLEYSRLQYFNFFDSQSKIQ